MRFLVGPNDLSALEAKQVHGLVVDGVKYVESRQERCGASWAEHLILFSHFVARASSITQHKRKAAVTKCTVVPICPLRAALMHGTTGQKQKRRCCQRRFW